MSVSAFVVPAMMAVFYIALYSASAKKVIVGKDNKTALRFPAFLKIVSIFCLLISIGVLFAYPYFETDNVEIKGMLLIGLLSAGSLYLGLLSKNHYVWFDDETVEVRNFLGKVRCVQWKELIDVDFLPFSKFIKLKDKEGRVVYVSTYIEGLDLFLDKFEAKTKWARTIVTLRHNRKF
jgi:hypothetical protein